MLWALAGMAALFLLSGKRGAAIPVFATANPESVPTDTESAATGGANAYFAAGTNAAAATGDVRNLTTSERTARLISGLADAPPPPPPDPGDPTLDEVFGEHTATGESFAEFKSTDPETTEEKGDIFKLAFSSATTETGDLSASKMGSESVYGDGSTVEGVSATEAYGRYGLA